MKHGREQLRGWIDRSGFDQRKAAAALGITEAYLSQLLAGDRCPSLTMAVKFEQETGIPTESWVLNGVRSPQPVVAGSSGKRRNSR